MRLSIALGCLLLAGCVGPHATGALWAQQNLEEEQAMFRLTDVQRAEQGRQFELNLADEKLAAERARVSAGLLDCPGAARQPLALSPGDRVRDGVRIHIQDDAQRLSALAQVAVADWQLRRAQATGDSQFCSAARSSLDGSPSSAARDTPGVIEQLGTATVVRDRQRQSLASLEAANPLLSLSLYALGSVDSVTAPAPLPQYLAAVYGGELLPRDSSAPTRIPGSTPQAAVDANSEGDGALAPELLVDRLAAAYPQWEPDALYEAFRGR